MRNVGADKLLLPYDCTSVPDHPWTSREGERRNFFPGFKRQILGIECTLLEVQKLGYFLERSVVALGLPNKFNFIFAPNKFGPYSDKLKHMLNGLDSSYLHCDKRLADAGPFDVIHFGGRERP